jgi:ketosteroid isomerase-like protein
MPRLKILRVLLIVSSASILLLSGCSAKQDPRSNDVDFVSVIEQWIEALNAGDSDQFELLHTDTVTYSSHIQKSSLSGRQNIWDSLRRLNRGAIERVSLFGQDGTMCLQVSATESKESFLYVFEFERDLISHIYSYSAEYYLPNIPVFEGVELSENDSELSGRIDVANFQVEYLNKRDFSGFLNTFNTEPILFVPPSTVPVVGIDGIENDVQSFVQLFNNVEFKVFRTFGQGNLVCQQLSVSKGPMGSLGFVLVFEGDKVSQTYEYLSQAEIGN